MKDAGPVGDDKRPAGAAQAGPGSVYGLGLRTENAGDFSVVGHGGSLKGVSSQIAWVPELGVGEINEAAARMLFTLTGGEGANDGLIVLQPCGEREEVERLVVELNRLPGITAKLIDLNAD